MQSSLLRFGAPPDAVAWTALVLAAGASILATRPPARLLDRAALSPRLPLTLLAIAAFLLSAGYVAHYLRGGPRIIDATSYWLEARALATGGWNFDVPAPGGSFRGRFLVTPPDGTSLGVIFPPGYPAILALGFLAGAPLWVGPLIAALTVVATHRLAHRLFDSKRIALLAALLSVLCAALRYHTADTMSHGWGALLWLVALLCALRGGALLPVAGLAAGWLIATRPVTGAAALLIVAAASRGHGWRALAGIGAGLVPGLTLLALHQRALTGSLLGSAQLRYYSLADGPIACFRYGFGDGVGCVFEHGDFVRARLADGFGAAEAAGTTLRRLHHHLLDVGNAEPLALLVPVAVVLGWRERGVRLLGAGVGALVLAYVPFYFDATYPGGGARLYAEALPLEHVLVAWALHRLRVARFAPPVALAGFALHASFSHTALRDREGGRPMFEPNVLSRAGVDRGLVFVGTDHGFNLGHRPGERGLVVARHNGDAHDWLLWRRLGEPPAHRYHYDPWAPRAVARVEPYLPVPSLRFEAEAEWPPLAIEGGFAHPGFPEGDCKSGGAALRLVPARSAIAVRLELLAPAPGSYRVVTGWVASAGAEVAVEGGARRWEGRPLRGCFELPGETVAVGADPEPLRVSVRGREAWLDYVELRAPEAPSGRWADPPRAPPIGKKR